MNNQRKNSGPCRAVIYCRVAGATASDLQSKLGAQEAACRKLAQARGYDIDRVFTDHASGTVADRPGLNAMLSFLRNARESRSTIVLAMDLARLSRNTAGHFEISDAIRKLGAEIETVS